MIEVDQREEAGRGVEYFAATGRKRVFRGLTSKVTGDRGAGEVPPAAGVRVDDALSGRCRKLQPDDAGNDERNAD